MRRRTHDNTRTTNLITISLQEYERLTKESAMLAAITSAPTSNIFGVVGAVKMLLCTDPKLAANGTKGATYK